jgi:hypothetical protein
LDANIAAREIVRAMKRGREQIVLPRWYRIAFVAARLFAPLVKKFGS